MRAADEQPVAGEFPERQVGNAVRNENLSEQFAVRRDAMNAIGGARPDIAVLVQAKPVAIPRLDLVEDIAAVEAAVGVDVEGPDVLAGIVRGLVAGFRYVESAFVRRKRQAVRPVEIYDLVFETRNPEPRSFSLSKCVGVTLGNEAFDPDDAVLDNAHIVPAFHFLNFN